MRTLDAGTKTTVCRVKTCAVSCHLKQRPQEQNILRKMLSICDDHGPLGACQTNSGISTGFIDGELAVEHW